MSSSEAPSGWSRLALKEKRGARLPDGYVLLAHALVVAGHRVIVTVAPGDQEKAIALVGAARQRSVVGGSMAGRLSLSESAALVAGAELVVAVSIRVLHLAAALELPLVTLYSPTNRRLEGPIGSSSIVATPEGAESGFLHLGFEYRKNQPDCMPFISADRVIKAAFDALKMAKVRRMNLDPATGDAWDGIYAAAKWVSLRPTVKLPPADELGE